MAASGGYDLPAYEKLTTLKTWAEEGPPKGTLYHYPNPAQPPEAFDLGIAGAAEGRPADLHAGDPDQDVPCAIYQGEAMEKTLAWAEGELEGFMRS